MDSFKSSKQYDTKYFCLEVISIHSKLCIYEFNHNSLVAFCIAIIQYENHAETCLKGFYEKENITLVAMQSIYMAHLPECLCMKSEVITSATSD